jgi:hypothetical protein
LDRIVGGRKNDWDCCRRGLRHSGGVRPAPSYQHFHLLANQVGCKSLQPIVVAIAKTKFDFQIAAFDIAGLIEPLSECGQNAFFCTGVGSPETEPTYGACRCLLRRHRVRR